MIAASVLFLTMFFLIRFYNNKIAPHTHFLEVNVAYLTAGLIVILVIIILFIPKKHKLLLKTFITLFLIVFIAGVSFWGVRPYNIIYSEVPKRIELLDSFLEETYPDRSWEIRKSESTFDNPYLMLVTFEDEPKKAYYYLMDDEVVKGNREISSTGSSVGNR